MQQEAPERLAPGVRGRGHPSSGLRIEGTGSAVSMSVYGSRDGRRLAHSLEAGEAHNPAIKTY